MITVYFEPAKQAAKNAVRNWRDNHPTWENDTVSHEIVATHDPLTDTEYVRGDFRFLQEDTAATLLDDLTNTLDDNSNVWYRIGYHECTHDEPDSSDSDWSEIRESGDIPEGVPAF